MSRLCPILRQLPSAGFVPNDRPAEVVDEFVAKPAENSVSRSFFSSAQRGWFQQD